MPLKQTLKWSMFLFLTTAVVNAADSSDRVTWNEFSMRVTPKHTIQMVLPDGTQIEGKLLQVKPDAIDARITRTSNPKAHPKGNATIRRESISVVDVRRPRRVGRLVGMLVPVGLGVLILGSFAKSSGSDDAASILSMGGALIGINGSVGYFVGREFDRSFDQFIIIPERQSEKSIP